MSQPLPKLPPDFSGLSVGGVLEAKQCSSFLPGLLFATLGLGPWFCSCVTSTFLNIESYCGPHLGLPEPLLSLSCFFPCNQEGSDEFGQGHRALDVMKKTRSMQPREERRAWTICLNIEFVIRYGKSSVSGVEHDGRVRLIKSCSLEKTGLP